MNGGVHGVEDSRKNEIIKVLAYLKAEFAIVGNLAKKLKLQIDVVVAQLQLMEVWEVTYDST